MAPKREARPRCGEVDDRLGPRPGLTHEVPQRGGLHPRMNSCNPTSTSASCSDAIGINGEHLPFHVSIRGLDFRISSGRGGDFRGRDLLADWNQPFLSRLLGPRGRRQDDIPDLAVDLIFIVACGPIR